MIANYYQGSNIKNDDSVSEWALMKFFEYNFRERLVLALSETSNLRASDGDIISITY